MIPAHGQLCRNERRSGVIEEDADDVGQTAVPAGLTLRAVDGWPM
jgi:hypothetical protein